MTASKAEQLSPLSIGGRQIPPGQSSRLELPIARLPATQVFLSLPVLVVRGSRPGPCIWLSAAIHGDELNGVEIIRRVRGRISPATLSGSLIAVPIVNTFGLINQSRYLPDRRDLNRSFPGSPRGSLASRLAHIFMQEIVKKCTHGIDFHTGSDHRTNLPQIRADLGDREVRDCAAAFGAPVLVSAARRDGSLREAARRLGIHVLVYEAGENQRFEAAAIEMGVEGALGVMSYLGMLEPREGSAVSMPAVATRTIWLRARASGFFRSELELGQRVQKKQRIGVISDSLGEFNAVMRSSHDGLVIGLSRNPLVRQGDGIVHLAIEFE